MKKIVAFGDSVMKGITTDPEQLALGNIKYRVSEDNFADACSKWLDIPIENYSKFGSTIRHCPKAMDRYMSRVEKDDIVVLEFGGNDCNFDWESISHTPDEKHDPQVLLEDFSEMYDAVIDRVEASGAKPVLLTRPPLASRKFFEHVSRGLNAENILKWMDNDVGFIGYWQEHYNLEIFKIGARRGVRVIDISSVFLRHLKLNELICIDGMHPNEMGHRLIASTIMRDVAPA